MLLTEEQELSLLKLRHRLVAMHVPFMYETQAEYKDRKRGRETQPWEPVLILWRPLTRVELNVLGC